MLTNRVVEESVWLGELERSFHLTGRATIMINRAGQVIAVSPEAEHYVNCELRIVGRRLVIADPVLNARLSALIDACVSHHRQACSPLPPPITFALSGGQALTVDACPIPRLYPIELTAPAAVVLIREADLNPGRLEQLLRGMYGLTICESRLAVALAENATLAAIAAKVGISIATARAHLKAIFLKTETHRQAELISLIAKLRL